MSAHLDPLPYVGMGECGFCGGSDAGHRVRDALLERFEAGDSIADLQDDYGLSANVVRELIAYALIERTDGEMDPL